MDTAKGLPTGNGYSLLRHGRHNRTLSTLDKWEDGCNLSTLDKWEDGCNLPLMERQRIQDPRRWAKRERDASCGGLHGARVYLRPWSDRRSRSTHLNHERQWHYQRLSCRVGGLGTLVVGTPLRGGLSPDNTVTVPPKCGSEQKGAGKLQGKFEFRMAVWGSLYS